ncbi:zinc finger BED domain-containing protein 5-like [Palaemon carinicauda]|uniref:zinc finger BED domain-containing protein 5-like n=1 Tax=Palaemon carinicauda TaxID=392227 RepID=UPI0035B66A7F
MEADIAERQFDEALPKQSQVLLRREQETKEGLAASMSLQTTLETMPSNCRLLLFVRELEEQPEVLLDALQEEGDTGEDTVKEAKPQIHNSRSKILPLDESTDVSSCSQLLVFVRYINSGDIKDEFLFCSALETTTKADDIMEKVSTFFQEEDLQWENVCGVCTDGAAAMLGSKSGFQSRVKKLAPQAKGIHCMIHRYALASKTLPSSLQEVLESVIKIVNYIKTKALNTCLFRELCKDMNADHEVLLFYTAVCWLSKGNGINRVFEMKDEIKLFLETQERKDLVVHFEDEAWNKRVAYLADIFDQLNKLNLKLQGRETCFPFSR